MKQNKLFTALSVIPAAIMLLQAGNAKANSQVSFDFECVRGQGNEYTTFVNSNHPDWGQPRRLVQWTETLGNGRYTPRARCNEITGRLQRVFNNSDTPYITHGVINNQPVICTSDDQGDSCNRLLITLDYRNGDGRDVLEQFFQIADSNVTGRPLRLACPLYINLQEYRSGQRVFAYSSCGD